MEPSPEVVSIEGGVKVEERRFIWRIKNFHVVMLHDTMINDHEMEFSAGESIDVASKWSVELSPEEEDGKKWVGIYLTIKERPSLKSDFLFAHCAFLVKNSEGEEMISEDTGIKNMYGLGENSSGWGISQFIERDDDVEEMMEEPNTLVIHVTFKLYSPTVIMSDEDKTIKNFLRESKKKALSILGPFPRMDLLTDIKIVSNDKRGFTMKKEILSAWSPVFEAMLKANMTEGRQGMVKIADMGSRSLSVLVHYMCVGELKPGWRQSEVLVELTNAAAKYQLTELLNFLDVGLGRVCDVRNVGALLLLANRLSLKQAEKDLLSFVRMKGTNSSESFINILKSVSFTVDPEPPHRAVGSTGGSDVREKDSAPSTSGSGNCNSTGKPVAVATIAGDEVPGNGATDKEPPSKKAKLV